MTAGGWINVAYGVLGLAAVIVGAVLPQVNWLIPLGAGVLGHSLPQPSVMLQWPKLPPELDHIQKQETDLNAKR